jgi:hypothetical protein
MSFPMGVVLSAHELEHSHCDGAYAPKYLGIEYISRYVLVRTNSLVASHIGSICLRGQVPRQR